MRNNEELGFFAPISFNRKEHGYEYTEEGYSIDKIPLKSEDLNSLQFAVSILNQFGYLSIMQNFSGAIEKIVDALNVNRIMAENSRVDFIEFEKNEYVSGGAFLEKIVTAIKEENKVWFEYKKHGLKETSTYTISPYLLKEYRNIWYLIGKDASAGTIKTFGLDRIREMEMLPESIEKDVKFDRKKYFQHSFGITSYHEEPEEIVLSFSRKTGDYIKAVPLHLSQEIIADSEKEFRIKLSVYPTYDFMMQILSYGAEVEVISPKGIRETMEKILSETLTKYRKD
jgi:predicted DNA-binding transcriptional regulator YafY